MIKETIELQEYDEWEKFAVVALRSMIEQRR